MHPDLEKLIPLQTLEIQAQRLREQMAAAPRRLAELEAQRQATAVRLASLVAELDREEAARRRLESDTADLRVKLERARKKLDAATTSAQVTALEHEVGFTQAEIGRLEDTELAGMERSEQLEAQKPAAEQALERQEAELASARLRAQETLAHDRAALAELDRSRAALRGEILTSPTGQASLARYDRIAGHRGTAIAEAMLGKCNACGMMVRPQLWQDLRDNSPESPTHDTLVSCENCGRILYYDPARDAPQRKPAHGESIAASIVRSSLP